MRLTSLLNGLLPTGSYSWSLELLLNKLNYTENFTTTNLQKNQYRPMRKGITSMVRLHATGAVAIPTEIRTHVLASSKDVIHSWAIPSDGIKIGCIPGYSSHRVVIFLTQVSTEVSAWRFVVDFTTGCP